MKQKTEHQKGTVENIYQLNGTVPIVKAIPFGLQHILAMFVANIAPILIVASACELSDQNTAMLIQSAMLIAGIGTLVQLFPIFHKIGSGLPIVMGISFTFVSILCFVGTQYGYGAIMGAVLIGGIIEGILGLFAKYWLKLIAPIVSASVVTAIGLTLLCCILFHIFAKSYWKQLSVLFGLVVGYLLAIAMGAVDFSALKDTSIFAVPHLLPFKMEFHPDAILSVTLIFLVSATETIGDTSALAASGLNRDVTKEETSGSIACDGFVSALSSVFGCLPITSFSQNVGLVAMTKVVNRFTIATGAGIMILAGIFPFFGALLATLPDAVLGGCTIMMFGTIVVSGLQMISKCGFSQRNITIAALSLSIGLGFTQCADLFRIFPQMVQNVFAQNCVAVVFLVAILLNLVLPKNMDVTIPSKSES